MKIIPSGRRDLQESTMLAVRYNKQVDVYNVDDWTPKYSHTLLSCSVAELYPPSGLEIDPSNTWFLTNGALGTGVYSLSTGNQLFFNSEAKPTRGAISKDGAYIAFGNYFDVIIIDTSTWSSTPVHTIASADMDVNMNDNLVLAWSHDGTKLAIGDKEGHLQIFNTSDWTAYTSSAVDLLDAIHAINFSPDDSEIAVSLSTFSTTNVLNVMTVQATLISGNVLGNNLSGHTSHDNVFNSTNTLLYGCSYSISPDAIMSFSTSSWTESDAITAGLNDGIAQLAISNDNKLLAVGLSDITCLVILDANNLNTTISGTPSLSIYPVYGLAFDHPK